MDDQWGLVMRLRVGPVAAALLTCAMLLFLIDGLQMDAAASRDSRYILEAFDDRVVHISQLKAAPGDVVQVFPERQLAGPFSHYDFLILAGGQGRAYVEDNASAQVLHEVRGLDPSTCCTRGPVHFTKPGLGDHHRLDLVWLFYYAQGTDRPAEEPAREYFDRWVKVAATAGGQSPGGQSAVVVKEWGVIAHRWLSAAGIASAVLGVVALGMWAWQDRSPPPGRPNAQGLVDLAQAGRIYLRRLASLLLVLLVPLLVAGWAVAGLSQSELVDIAGPQEGWYMPIVWGVRIAWLAVAVGWFLQWLRVRKRLEVWEREPQV